MTRRFSFSADGADAVEVNYWQKLLVQSFLAFLSQNINLGGLTLINKQVWPDLLKVFEPGLGDSVGSPLRYSALCYVAKLSNERSAAKPIDDFVIVHAESIAHYTATVQHALPTKV